MHPIRLTFVGRQRDLGSPQPGTTKYRPRRCTAPWQINYVRRYFAPAACAVIKPTTLPCEHLFVRGGSFCVPRPGGPGRPRFPLPERGRFGLRLSQRWLKRCAEPIGAPPTKATFPCASRLLRNRTGVFDMRSFATMVRLLKPLPPYSRRKPTRSPPALACSDDVVSRLG
jgi:hypothetical protein